MQAACESYNLHNKESSRPPSYTVDVTAKYGPLDNPKAVFSSSGVKLTPTLFIPSIARMCTHVTTSLS
ncbi:hypothetical protein PISMIDRAFT_684234 [Pisolithus microcarpus 441]|uniref:Uncharacterized protein n=1 Tax=Pisolithus microcarpus 441 TaxID=765257 RepID=A0A0C9YWL9_9AGAM|nr:hypothetical protein PISMIDRAFT_684234 [Pisolithus microcarpus 441]